MHLNHPVRLAAESPTDLWLIKITTRANKYLLAGMYYLGLLPCTGAPRGQPCSLLHQPSPSHASPFSHHYLLQPRREEIAPRLESVRAILGRPRRILRHCNLAHSMLCDITLQHHARSPIFQLMRSEGFWGHHPRLVHLTPS